MKIWDIFPGYLGRTLLLVEHRECHALAALHEQGQQVAEDIDPRANEWLRHFWALTKRHEMVVAEMMLLNLEHNSPLPEPEVHGDWPPLHPQLGFIKQYAQVARLHSDARIPIPDSSEQLWYQVSHSVSARDQEAYRALSEAVHHGRVQLPELENDVSELLRQPASFALWEQAIDTLWQTCLKTPEAALYRARQPRPHRRMKAIQFLAARYGWLNLWQTTAITDLNCCVIKQ